MEHSTPPIFTDDGYAFIRATNIKNGKIVTNDMKYIPQEEADRLEKCKLSEWRNYHCKKRSKCW